MGEAITVSEALTRAEQVMAAVMDVLKAASCVPLEVTDANHEVIPYLVRVDGQVDISRIVAAVDDVDAILRSLAGARAREVVRAVCRHQDEDLVRVSVTTFVKTCSPNNATLMMTGCSMIASAVAETPRIHRPASLDAIRMLLDVVLGEDEAESVSIASQQPAMSVSEAETSGVTRGEDQHQGSAGSEGSTGEGRQQEAEGAAAAEGGYDGHVPDHRG